MGHVDHGKTSLLDKIRNSSIAAKEAGGITQHIGASEVPIAAIEKICGEMLRSMGTAISIPGLLFIDTPGHEAFTNLRKRGGSVADLAILVVDITKGFEPQTIEAIEILKEYKTPFIIAANKVDLINGWIKTNQGSIMKALVKQNSYVQEEFDKKVYDIIGMVSEHGFTSERFDKVSDFKKELAIIPLSAKTGEGVAELLMLVTGLSQKFLEMKLNIEVGGQGKGSILEKREVKGLGVTIDVILYSGTLKVNDTIAFATQDSIQKVKIKALLKPKPMHEIRESSSAFYYVDSVSAAAGVKISATGLEDAVPGSPVIQVTGEDYTSQIQSEIGDLFKTKEQGIVLKGDSIGSIEAICKLLESEGIAISRKGLGMVTKRDVLDAFGMYAKDPTQAVVLAFNVQEDQDAITTAASSNVKIINGNIIYKLIDDYKAHASSMQKDAGKRLEKELIFPGKIEVLANRCFRGSNPAIFGVIVVEGRILPGYLMMNEHGVVVGKIKGIQNDKLAADIARKGESVAISMDEPTFGRQVKENEYLYTRVKDVDERLLSGKLSNMLNAEEKELLNHIITIKKSAKEYKEQ